MEPWSLFPGVYTELRDTTYAIPADNSTTAFMCIMSEKGPDNQLTLVGRADDFITQFGDVNVAQYGQGQKIALEYLNYANLLYIIRVTPDHTNCSAMSTIYKGLYGEYKKSAITMTEASYANIGLAINETGECEFIYVGPQDFGNILSITTSTPPASPALNDRYYIPASQDATGTWKGHEGDVAICISTDPVVWSYVEVSDTSTAIIDNTNMVAAVTYAYLDPLALWRDYENVYTSSETYATVKDIIRSLPDSAPEDGDAYVVCANPVDIRLAGHEMQVIVYVKELNEWYFEKYTKIFLEKEYIITNDEPEDPQVGDRVIIGDSPSIDEWVGHERMFAEYTSSGWVFLEIEVADPEDKSSFQSLVLDQYISETATNRIEYKKVNVFVKDVVWTTDENAKFCAYVHKATQFTDIVNAHDPNKADEDNLITPFLILYPIGRGRYYNGMHVNMTLSTSAEHEDTDADKTLILDIYDTREGSVLKVESFEVSLNPNRKDLQGNSMFIEDVVNTYSKHLRVAINRDVFTDSATFNTNIHSDIALLFAKYMLRTSMSGLSIPPALMHGTDGSVFDKYGNIDWETATSILVKAYKGEIVNPMAQDADHATESTILDRQQILLDLIFDAGYPYDVKVAINQLIEARHQDCFGIIDNGDNASASAAYKQRTEEGGMTKWCNTPFIAIYEPYTLVYDEYSGRDMWISPIFHAVRAYALTDMNYGKYQAPAGTIRGNCPNVKKLRYNLNRESSYQNSFMSYNINPIIMNQDGYAIWNQSTSYLKTSKYQDINVVREILQIRKDLEQALRGFLFEINDETTWDLVNASVTSYLANLVSEQAIEDFTCSVYASDYDVTLHKLRVDVAIQPKQVLYQILLSISV